jgi:hypothetical protein
MFRKEMNEFAITEKEERERERDEGKPIRRGNDRIPEKHHGSSPKEISTILIS